MVLPAVSKDALKRMSEEVRSWRIHLHDAKELEDIAASVNPRVRGWITYYGRFFRSALEPLLRRINSYLVRWRDGSTSGSGDQEDQEVVGRADREAAAHVAHWKITTGFQNGL